jgi:hypothetical protein
VDEPASVTDRNPNVDAFNPCLPNLASPSCPRHPIGAAGYAPFAENSPAESWSDPNFP